MQTLRNELSEHGLDGIVQLTHRDVCTDGFLLPSTESPNAEAVFLDLPAPWLALRHLNRTSPSALHPESPINLCTFSPCIEQVQATVSFLRKNGWTEIQMVEVQNKRIDVRREQVGLRNEGLRGVNATPATVGEAVDRLREVETKLADFHATKNGGTEVNGSAQANRHGKGAKKIESKAERLQRIQTEAEERKLYKEGNLVHRSEPEVKTHTSYLVFAVLPREWNEADELDCLEQWPVEELMKSRNPEEKGNVAAAGKLGDAAVV